MAQLTGAADWFKLRVPYDCSSLVHYYQLQGAFWKDHIGKIKFVFVCLEDWLIFVHAEEKVNKYMERQGCENTQRGKYINSCLGNHNNSVAFIHFTHIILQ